jgi:hypothetical protein
MDALRAVPMAWRGMPAWLVMGERLEAVLTVTGCHLACLRERGETLTPLWQPPWAAAEPSTVVPAPGGSYGNGPEAPLLGCIVGSNLCLDRFGAPWPGERRPMHGEAGVVRYERAQPTSERIDFTAWLPEARLRIERHVHLEGATLHLATTVRHLGGAERAVEWCEHTNIGGAFLDGVRVRADVDRVVNWPGVAEPGSRFASAAPESALPIATALAVPADRDAPCGDAETCSARAWQAASTPPGSPRIPASAGA